MISALNPMLPAFCAAGSLNQYYCLAAPANMKPGTSGMFCVFLDNTDVANNLAYHTESSNIPFAKVFVKTILQYNGAILMGANNTVPTVAQAFAHEVFEMILMINSVNPFILDDNKVTELARTSAVNKAKTKAASYAKMIGVKLGRVIYLVESPMSSTYPIYATTAKADSGSIVDLGEQKITVSVTVRWEISYLNT